MKNIETETQGERTCQVVTDLVGQAEELFANSRKTKILLLTCAVTMLAAGKEYLGADTIDELDSTRERLDRELSESSKNREGTKGPKYLKLVKVRA